MLCAQWAVWFGLTLDLKYSPDKRLQILKDPKARHHGWWCEREPLSELNAQSSLYSWTHQNRQLLTSRHSSWTCSWPGCYYKEKEVSSLWNFWGLPQYGIYILAEQIQQFTVCHSCETFYCFCHWKERVKYWRRTHHLRQCMVCMCFEFALCKVLQICSHHHSMQVWDP